MANPIGWISKILGALAAVLASMSPAAGAVFSIAPGSSLGMSGTMAIQISSDGETVNLSSELLPQAAGSLTAALTGTVIASSDGANLTFPGGSAIALVDSGAWQPYDLPASIAMQAEFSVADPGGGGTVTLQLVGAVRNLTYDLIGTVPLAGAPGNQSFNTGGLQLATLSGTWDGALTLCTAQCEAPVLFSLDLSGPPASDLDSGAGSYVFDPTTQTLAFPIALFATESATETADGVTITVTGTLALAGSVAATAPIPEPATWVLFLVGAVGLVGYNLRRRVA